MTHRPTRQLYGTTAFTEWQVVCNATTSPTRFVQVRQSALLSRARVTVMAYTRCVGGPWLAGETRRQHARRGRHQGLGGDRLSRDAVALVGPVGEVFFFSSRRRHTRFDCDWSSDVCSSD